MLTEEVDSLEKREHVAHHHILPVVLWEGVYDDADKLCLVKRLHPAQHEPIVFHLQVPVFLGGEVKVAVQLLQLRYQIPQLKDVGFLDLVLEVAMLVFA